MVGDDIKLCIQYRDIYIHLDLQSDLDSLQIWLQM